jgi:hypothetical protein
MKSIKITDISVEEKLLADERSSRFACIQVDVKMDSKPRVEEAGKIGGSDYITLGNDFKGKFGLQFGLRKNPMKLFIEAVPENEANEYDPNGKDTFICDDNELALQFVDEMINNGNYVAEISYIWDADDVAKGVKIEDKTDVVKIPELSQFRTMKDYLVNIQ